MPSRKTPLTEYDKLRAIWYAKLEKEGFKDIEQDDDNLKVWTANLTTRRQTPETWEAKETYYRLAYQFLCNYKFDSKIEKVIWEYHSEGLSIRNIVQILKKLRFKKIGEDSPIERNIVWAIVKKLQKTMKTMYVTETSAT